MSEICSITSVTKLPLKRVEPHLQKFNDVAIPHHVDLLKKHKSNIGKFQESCDWDRIHSEQINATRLVKQLKALLYEMDMLRNQVQDSDIPKFDKFTANARASALQAIKEYLAMHPEKQSPLRIASNVNSEVNFGEEEITNGNREVLASQLKLSLKKEDVEKQEECLKSWENLKTEIQDIHDLFEEFAHVVQDQKESVDEIETNVEVAATNVAEGERHLQTAVKYKSAVYPLAGALLGGCLGGPIGLFAGAKLGSLAAIGCGFLGFTGGRILKKKQEKQHQDIEMLNINEQRNVKGSVSLPTLNNIECKENDKNS